MALPYNGQNVPVGPKAGTISINSVSYVVEGYTFDDATERGIRRDAENIITGNWLHSQDVTGTMTLQLASGTTALPPIGQTGSFDFQTGSAITIVVSKCSLPVQRGEDRKVTIDWFKAVA